MRVIHEDAIYIHIHTYIKSPLHTTHNVINFFFLIIRPTYQKLDVDPRWDDDASPTSY